MGVIATQNRGQTKKEKKTAPSPSFDGSSCNHHFRFWISKYIVGSTSSNGFPSQADNKVYYAIQSSE
jgi:hypothetical protein